MPGRCVPVLAGHASSFVTAVSPRKIRLKLVALYPVHDPPPPDVHTNGPNAPATIGAPGTSEGPAVVSPVATGLETEAIRAPACTALPAAFHW